MGSRLKGKRVLVTGASGFLGKALMKRLRDQRCAALLTPRSDDYDLRCSNEAGALLRESRPDLVIHLAALAGGIGANRAEPGRFLHDNLLMGTHLVEQSRLAGVEKLVAIGTICAYPKHARAPFREEELWNGYPEETNAPYGLAKKLLLVQLQAYRQQYGFNGVYLLPTNLYGPRDNFDPRSSHVIPALIRKCLEAKERGDESIRCWGTGAATREFLFVEDCAQGILQATQHYDGCEPVNLGCGREVSIRRLAEMIAAATGFEGRLDWDPSYPDGQPRRLLDTSRARELFGFRARTRLADGLARTIAWYRGQRAFEQAVALVRAG